MAVQYYTATSLDGFIATADDDVSWLDLLPQPTPSTYEGFIAGIGAIVMGRSTYDFLADWMAKGNDWPYKQPTWVFTNRPADAPEADVRFVKGPVDEHMKDIQAAAGDKNIWLCGGGDLVGQFFDGGFLDEIHVHIASATLGSGKPLLPRAIIGRLHLRSARAMGEGFAELIYDVR